jgi:hypothetical protein
MQPKTVAFAHSWASTGKPFIRSTFLPQPTLQSAPCPPIESPSNRKPEYYITQLKQQTEAVGGSGTHEFSIEQAFILEYTYSGCECPTDVFIAPHYLASVNRPRDSPRSRSWSFRKTVASKHYAQIVGFSSIGGKGFLDLETVGK